MIARFAPVRGGLLLALALGLALPAATPAQIVIDEFTTNQATLTDPPGGASSVAAGGADILGQRRDLQVKRLAGAGPVTAAVAGGQASFAVTATTPDSAGLALVTWDGDSDPLVLDPTGLGGVDLTGGGAAGFQLTIASASAGLGLQIEVWTDAGNASQAMRTLPTIAAPTGLFVAYSEFLPTLGTGADFADVGALRMTVYGGDGQVLALDRIVTGTPSVAALKADFDTSGVPLATVSPGGTVRYRVTITNTGSEARTLALTDVLDPNTTLASAVRSTPIARVDQYQAFADLPFDSAVEGAPALVANDGDPDGNAVAAVPAVGQATSQGGSVTIQADGSFVYTPGAGFVGVDSFTYQIAVIAGDPTTDANGTPISPPVGRAYLLVVPVPPTVTAGGTLAYTENDPATAIDTTITVTDPDSNVVGATAQITGNYANGEDVLSCGAPCAGLSPTFVAGTGTLTLTGSATPAAYQTALRGVRYANGSENPSTASRTVTWIADDGFGTSAPVTSTITVTAVNDPPVVTPSAGVTSFVEDGGPVTVDAALTVTDPDNANLASASVTLLSAPDGGAEALAVPAACAGLTVTPGNPLTISGSATVAAYQTCLRSVTYNNTSQNPSAAQRTVRFVVHDGAANSNNGDKGVSVTPVNDPPVAGADLWQTVGNTRLVVDLPALATPHVRDTTPLTFGVLDNDADPAEGDAFAVSAIVGCADATPPFGDSPACATANGGAVVMEANGRFTYTPPVGNVANDSFQYTVTDTGSPPASANGTVTIQFFERVWYVENDSAAGGLGRSHDPFDTLAEAQTASAAGDWIFVHFGDGTSAGQAAGIVLKAGQHLVGEHAGLSIPVDLNGNGTAQVLSAAVPGNRPRIDNSGAGNNAVSATDAIPTEIVGLSLQSAAGNAVDLTLTGAFSSSGNLTILNNEIRGAGAEGIDVNSGGTGTLTLALSGNLWNVAGTHTGNAIDVARTGGTLRLNLGSNTNILSAATAVSIVGGAAASTIITGFANNTVHQNTAGSGILVGNATFDATPGGAYNTVSGGATTVGIVGDGVGGAAMALSNVAGDLSFTDLDLFGASGLILSGTGAVNVGAGTGMRLTVPPSVATIQSTNGPAVDASATTIDFQLAQLSVSASATTGVSLVNVADGSTSATFSAPTGSSITSAAGTAFNVDGGNATVTYNGTIGNTAGRSVAVQNRTGDTATFTGAVTDSGTGILVNANNAASTTNFQGGLSLTTGANAAFTATNGGTLNVCDENPCNPGSTGGLVNTITTTTGTALNVSNTTIGANNLEFRSISAGTAASGPTNGILLNTTGSSGGLKVKGTGGAGSGGTIRRCSTGISLTGTRGVALSRMQLNDFTDFAIRGASVVNFDMDNTVINGVNGDNAAADEGSVRFTELTGSANVTSCNISGGFEDNFKVVNSTGSLNRLTFDGVTIGANSTTDGNDGIGLESTGATTVMNVTVQNGFFTSARGDLFQLNVIGNSTADLVFTGNQLSNNHPGIATGGGGVTISGGDNTGTGANLTMNMSNNTFRDANGHAILFVKSTDPGTFKGTFASNQIGIAAVANSGSVAGSGIKVQNAGLGTVTVAVTDNTIRQYNNFGIELLTGGGASALSGALNATISGNTVSNPGTGGLPMNGVHLNGGTVPGDTYQICTDVGGAGALANNLVGSGANGGTDFRLRQRQATTVRLPGYGGANNNDAAVVAFVQGRNTGGPSGLASNTVPTGGGFVGGAACPLP